MNHVDIDTVYAAIPLTGDISSRDLFIRLNPGIECRYRGKEYQAMQTKVRKLRSKSMVHISRLADGIFCYARTVK